ncbi:hypothetical protein CB1_002341007 [Camelus ferus]|nr:hypothetical protein CB1_002341007 [Camelus ferus]
MWDQRLVRLAVVQQLRAVYGIKVKGGRGQCDRKRLETAAAEIVGKIFGVPFNALPQCVVPEYGHIPRSSENKMDSSNLAVIFAPNLLQTSEGHEKMSANTEKKLRLQAAVVQTLIDCASDIGHVPDFILEKIPAMLGIDGLCATPSLEGFEEGECETPGDYKRKRRQSVGVHFDTSPEGSSQSSLSPVAISGNHLISTGVLRRSKRIASKKVCRVESGKAGCFSPKISRKEKVRRSLRLKFSLGKSSKDGMKTELENGIHSSIPKVFWLTFGWTLTSAYSPRTPDRVSETDIQRLLHGVMEQLGIARPRVEYPAHQAMNLVGPQSIEDIKAAPNLEMPSRAAAVGMGTLAGGVDGAVLFVSVKYPHIRTSTVGISGVEAQPFNPRGTQWVVSEQCQLLTYISPRPENICLHEF